MPLACRYQRNFLEAPALSSRMRIFWPAGSPVSVKKALGSWESAVSKTLMWSSALFACALPGRSRAARISPVPLFVQWSQEAMNGAKP